MKTAAPWNARVAEIAPRIRCAALATGIVGLLAQVDALEIAKQLRSAAAEELAAATGDDEMLARRERLVHERERLVHRIGAEDHASAVVHPTPWSRRWCCHGRLAVNAIGLSSAGAAALAVAGVPAAIASIASVLAVSLVLVNALAVARGIRSLRRRAIDGEIRRLDARLHQSRLERARIEQRLALVADALCADAAQAYRLGQIFRQRHSGACLPSSADRKGLVTTGARP